MKNIIVFAIKSLFIIGVGISFAVFAHSCKAHSGTASPAQTEKMQRAREKEEQREYRKAYKQHLDNQDKKTKKRMKKQINEQKKTYKTSGKGKAKYPCPSSNPDSQNKKHKN